MIKLKRLAAGTKPPLRELRRHLRRLLARLWKEFKRSFKRCRAKFSEDSVHQLRVESRRLQALLGLLGTLAGDEHIAPTHRRVKKVLARFAQLRDTQVLLLELEGKLQSFPEIKPFRDALRERERRLIRKAREGIRHVRLGKIKAGIAAADRDARRVLADQRREDRHRQAMLDIVEQTVTQVVFLREHCRADNVQTIHRLRIAFKRFRYMMELLQPVLPGVRRREVRRLRTVQDRLGAIQDADVLVTAIDKFIRDRPEHAIALRRFHRSAERRRDARIRAFLSGPDRIHEFRLKHPAG